MQLSLHPIPYWVQLNKEIKERRSSEYNMYRIMGSEIEWILPVSL